MATERGNRNEEGIILFHSFHLKEPGGFAVRVPEITTKNPGGAVKKEVTLDGKFFGTAKGKVLFEVGGKLVSGKVTYWYMEPASGASTLRFVVPGKNVSRGTYTLRVTNKVGTGTVSFTVTP